MKKIKKWKNIPNDGTIFRLIVGTKKYKAYWKGAMYNLSHPNFGGRNKSKFRYSPILAVIDSNCKFKFSFFGYEYGVYGKDWWVEVK